MTIRTADLNDIPELLLLINSAYRGEVSKKGWTTEADLVSGDLRTDEGNLNELMQLPDAGFLVYQSEIKSIAGCVFFQQREPGKMYFGMLSVSPDYQAEGIGKKLMKALDEYSIEKNCKVISMRVISIRKELIDWYKRLDYYETGEKQAFPTGPFGTAMIPLEFVVMQKDIL